MANWFINGSSHPDCYHGTPNLAAYSTVSSPAAVATYNDEVVPVNNPEQEAYITIKAVPTGSDGVGAFIRAKKTGDTGLTGYCVWAQSDRMAIYKGDFTKISDDYMIPGGLQVGDKIGIQAFGDYITAWYKPFTLTQYPQVIDHSSSVSSSITLPSTIQDGDLIIIWSDAWYGGEESFPNDFTLLSQIDGGSHQGYCWYKNGATPGDAGRSVYSGIGDNYQTHTCAVIRNAKISGTFDKNENTGAPSGSYNFSSPQLATVEAHDMLLLLFGCGARYDGKLSPVSSGLYEIVEEDIYNVTSLSINYVLPGGVGTYGPYTVNHSNIVDPYYSLIARVNGDSAWQPVLSAIDSDYYWEYSDGKYYSCPGIRILGTSGQVTNFAAAQLVVPGHILSDFATIAGKTTPTGSEISGPYLDESTIDQKTTISAVEAYTTVDAATVGSQTNITSDEIPALTDGDTLITVTAIISTDIAAYVDSSTVADTTIVYSSDIYTGSATEYIDANQINGVTTFSYSEAAAFVDLATTASITTAISSELNEFIDAKEIDGVTSLSAAEIIAYVDSATIVGITTPSSIELTEYVDAATVIGITTVSSVDIRETYDSATITSITYITSVEIYSAEDANTIVSITDVISDELYHEAISLDSATILSITYVTSEEVFKEVLKPSPGGVPAPTPTPTIVPTIAPALFSTGVLTTTVYPRLSGLEINIKLIQQQAPTFPQYNLS